MATWTCISAVGFFHNFLTAQSTLIVLWFPGGIHPSLATSALSWFVFFFLNCQVLLHAATCCSGFKITLLQLLRSFWHIGTKSLLECWCVLSSPLRKKKWLYGNVQVFNPLLYWKEKSTIFLILKASVSCPVIYAQLSNYIISLIPKTADIKSTFPSSLVYIHRDIREQSKSPCLKYRRINLGQIS